MESDSQLMMEAELMVVGSQLHGKTQEQLVRDFCIDIMHWHNPHQQLLNRKEYSPKEIVKLGQILHIRGSSESILKIQKLLI